MDKRIYRVSSIIMYVTAILILLFYSIMTFRIQFTEISRLILLCGSCLFLYFGGFFLSKYLNNNKPMKINLWIYFILYIILLLILTLFDPMYGRSFSIVDWSKELFNKYINNSFNIIPFHTIIDYISKFNSLYDTKTIMINLLGNLIALMPMAIFLPLLFKKTRKLKNFILTVVIIVFCIEIVQFLTLTGSCDIDDIILNVTGAIIAYIIFKVNSINNLIRNIFLLEDNKISRKSYFKIILSIVIILIIVAFILVYRNTLYNKNIENYNNINNPNVTFEYNNECSNNNLFYEDKIYKYYFECYNNDDFYVIVNDKDKFSVEEFLDYSKYNYDINRILYGLDYYNIKYKIEHKYTYFNIEIKNNSNGGYYVPSNIDSDIAELVLVDKTNNDKILNYEINIIPKKSGSKIMSVVFELTNEFGETEKINKQFDIIVDENLDVSYSEKS